MLELSVHHSQAIHRTKKLLFCNSFFQSLFPLAFAITFCKHCNHFLKLKSLLTGFLIFNPFFAISINLQSLFAITLCNCFLQSLFAITFCNCFWNHFLQSPFSISFDLFSLEIQHNANTTIISVSKKEQRGGGYKKLRKAELDFIKYLQKKAVQSLGVVKIGEVSAALTYFVFV